MTFDDEQKDLLKQVDAILDARHSGYGWGHYQGDVIPRIISHYLRSRLPINLNVIGPNVYVKDVSIEFDLMVVDRDAEPELFTSAYPAEQVRCVMQIKRSGAIAGADFKQGIQRIKSNFDQAVFGEVEPVATSGKIEWHKKRPRCGAAYIALSEAVDPKKAGSADYGRITREVLAPYPAFIMLNSRSNEILPGEWQRLVAYLSSGPQPAH